MTATHNPEEIAHFEQLADRWWDPSGPLKTLHAINPVRHHFVTQAIKLDGLTLLDVGCGGGLYCHAAQQAGATVTGIDLSPGALASAQSHTHQSISYLETSAQALAAEQPGHFDVVTCFELLEHVPNPEALVQACFELAKPNGQLFFSTVNRTPMSFAGAIVAAEWLLNLVPRGTHHYDQFIRPAELSQWIENAKGHVHDVRGLRYHPWSNQASLSSDVNINYLVRAQKKDNQHE